MSNTIKKRKDAKGRVLNQNEYQKSNGLYEFRYYDSNGILRSEYSWRLSASDKLPRGKRKCRPLREIENEILRAVGDDINIFEAKKITLNDCFDKYIAGKVELKQSTRDNYRYMYDKYVRDSIGNKKIQEFKYTDILSYYKQLIYEKNFKPNSMEIIHTILHPIFNNAMRDGLIRSNPCSGVIKEIKASKDWVKSKRVSLTIEQQKTFMNYINESEIYNHWKPIMVLLLGTGLRIGEAIGLTWDDCDFEKKQISVNHSLLYRKEWNGHTKFSVQTPKTKSGIRVIPMFDEVRDVLIDEKERQKKVGTAGTIIDGVGDWVFTNKYKTVFTPASINRAINRICESYNEDEIKQSKKENREPLLLPHFSAHNLRHTFCTRLCENEPRIKIVQDIMGHSDISKTMDIYTDVSNELKKDSFESLQGKLYIY